MPVLESKSRALCDAKKEGDCLILRNSGAPQPSFKTPSSNGFQHSNDPSLPPRKQTTPGKLVTHESRNAMLDAVVKLHVTHCSPNQGRPWQMSSQWTSTSSGFILPNKLILTNYHSIKYATVLRIKKRASDTKYAATVLAKGPDCDLALLSVQEDEFWDGLESLDFGDIPKLEEGVRVVGYPLGGKNVSVTAGVVSRIELHEYSGSGSLLSVQIDAAINPGNSGGPAFNEKGEVVGVAFQGYDSAENIGYLIPVPVVNHFLHDFKTNSKYTGFAHCGFFWQTMENAAIRRYMKMKKDESGVLVLRVIPTSPAMAQLRSGDIVTSVDGSKISNAGTIPFLSGERISFQYLISTKFVGDTAKLEIIRDGEQKTVEYVLQSTNSHFLVPVHVSEKPPKFFIIGGLVFLALTEPYLDEEYGCNWRSHAPVHLSNLFYHGEKRFEKEEVILLSHVLDARITADYDKSYDVQLKKVNDIEVKNLLHLAKIVTESEDTFLKFDLEYDTIILDRVEAITANESILRTHNISKKTNLYDD